MAHSKGDTASLDLSRTFKLVKQLNCWNLIQKISFTTFPPLSQELGQLYVLPFGTIWRVYCLEIRTPAAPRLGALSFLRAAPTSLRRLQLPRNSDSGLISRPSEIWDEMSR